MRLERSTPCPLKDSTVSDFEAIFRTPAEARQVELTVTSGTVPADLKGTLLRNGPGVQRAGQTPLHFLDGYAFIASARFEAGRVVYSARHVDLPIARQEQAAGRLLARRVFTNRPGGRLGNALRVKPHSSASHDVYAWGGSVVAADLDGHHALDPATLDTTGPAPVNRLLGGLATLSAMPRVDPFTGHLVVYTATPGVLGADRIAIVEFDAQWNERARVERSLGVKGAVPHDLTTTENHYIVVQLGMLSVPQAAAGGCTFIDAIGLQAQGARILVIPRRGDGPLRSLPLPPGCQSFHLANAYEEDGLLVVDTALHEGLVDFSRLNPAADRQTSTHAGRGGGGPFIARHTLRLDGGEHRVMVHRQAPGEAPSVRDDLAGRRHRFAYTSVQGSRGDEPVDNAYYWNHAVAKIDCDAGATVSLWDAGPRVHVTAPQFVARGEAEDDGWVMTWTHDLATDRGELVLLDAQHLASGPVVRLALPAPLPPASHVCWAA